MLSFYQNLSRMKKILLALGLLLSIPIGGLLGLLIGLVAVSFIPICCNDAGCHNCFEFNGMVGYEATGYIGFWVGLLLGPLAYIFLISRFAKTEKSINGS